MKINILYTTSSVVVNEREKNSGVDIKPCTSYFSPNKTKTPSLHNFSTFLFIEHLYYIFRLPLNTLKVFTSSNMVHHNIFSYKKRSIIIIYSKLFFILKWSWSLLAEAEYRRGNMFIYICVTSRYAKNI